MHFSPPELKLDKESRKITPLFRIPLELEGMMGGCVDSLGAPGMI